MSYTIGMKTAISIPDHVFEAAERLASDRGWSRSRLYTEAVSDFVERHGAERVTHSLNELYAEEESGLPASVLMLQEASIPEEDW